MNATCHAGCGRLLKIALVLTVLMAASSVSARDIGDDRLRAVHVKTAKRFSDVRHVSAKELAAMRLSKVRAPLTFDVREKQEYTVSHLAGAIQVDPDISVAEFLRRFSGLIQDRIVVVYCSVGVRSMRLAARVQGVAKSAGAQATYNLAGGVFNWHNQSRPLANTIGPTNLIHPYNWTWSRLVTRRELISYTTAHPR